MQNSEPTAGAAMYDLDNELDDERQDLINAQQQLLFEQQLTNEFLNAAAEDSGDDDEGLMLGGGPIPNDMNQKIENMLLQESQIQPGLVGGGTSRYKTLPKLKNWIQWFLSLEDHEYYLEVD